MKRKEIVADNDVRGYCGSLLVIVLALRLRWALALCFLSLSIFCGLSIDLVTATFYEFLCIMSDPTGI